MCATDDAMLRHVPGLLDSLVTVSSAPVEAAIVSTRWRARDCDRLRAAFPTITFHFLTLPAERLGALTHKLHLSPLTYARLLMAEMVDWERFVYFDIDMVVQADPMALQALPLGEAPAAAVFHEGVLNAGLLVINARVWRARGLGTQMIEYAREFQPREADQGAIEAVIGPEMLRLDERWNTRVDPVWGRPLLDQPGYLENAWVVHFITGFKPWNLGRLLLPRPYAQAWARHARRIGLPVKWRTEAKILAWQLRILAKRALGRA